MAMVAATLRRQGKRVITVRSSILYDKCMHLARVNDQSYTNKFNLNLQRTAPSTGSLRAHHSINNAIPNINAYKKPGAGYFECRYTSATKFTTAQVNTTMEEETKAKAKQGDDQSSNLTFRIGVEAVSIMLCTKASHSLVSAHHAKAMCLETKATAPTTVTMDKERFTCDTNCVIQWQMQNMMFTWTFLVMPSTGKWDMVLGLDWMKHVGPLNLDVDQGPITIAMPHGMYLWLTDGARG